RAVTEVARRRDRPVAGRDPVGLPAHGGYLHRVRTCPKAAGAGRAQRERAAARSTQVPELLQRPDGEKRSTGDGSNYVLPGDAECGRPRARICADRERLRLTAAP